VHRYADQPLPISVNKSAQPPPFLHGEFEQESPEIIYIQKHVTPKRE
jgi:hypothetical protein